MRQRTTDNSNDALAKLARQFSLRFIVLYGSQASGRMQGDSDLDVAVVGDHELSFDTFFALMAPLETTFHQFYTFKDFDLVDFQRADPLLRYEIVAGGRLVAGNPDAYEALAVATQRAYEDSRSLFALERRLVHKFQQRLTVQNRSERYAQA
jgi:predicted nucleotidyltransferase